MADFRRTIAAAGIPAVIAPGKALSYSELADAAYTLAADMPPLLPLTPSGGAPSLLRSCTQPRWRAPRSRRSTPRSRSRSFPPTLPPGTLAVMYTSGTTRRAATDPR